MIKYFQHTEIEKDKWNRCIAEATFKTVFAEYDFLTLASPNWVALIQGDYDYVMPLPVRSKLSIQYVYTPFFFSQLGIFSKYVITNQLVNDFINQIPRTYKQVDLVLNPSNPVENIDIHTIRFNSYCLKLSRPHLLMQQLFTDNCRRNIKSAEKSFLTLSEDVSVKDVVTLFRANRGKDKSVHYHQGDYPLLFSLAELAQKNGKLEIFGAKTDNGELIAGALFLQDYDRILFWFSGRDKKYYDKKAMFFIVNEYLKLKENSELVLDFNGSMNKNIARFYRGFGAEPYQYPMLNFTRAFYLHPFIRLYKAIIK